MIKFVRIDTEYIKALRSVDKNVQSNAPEQGKQTKPFLGVLFEIPNSSVEYFVPLSSPKEKHKKMKNSPFFHKVIDEKNNKLRAVLNFNNMIPVVPSLYTKVIISQDQYRSVIQPEYIYCQKNEALLKNKAVKYYNRYTKGYLTPNEKKITCDFYSLERTLQNYQATQLTKTQETPDASIKKPNSALKSILKMEGQTTTLIKPGAEPGATPTATSTQKPKLTFGIGKKPGKGGGSAL